MKITPTHRFRDGRTTYDPGTEYEVPDLDGALPGPRPAPESVTVDIQPDSVVHNASATEV